MKPIVQYFYNLLIALDCLGNAVIGGNPHQTISARLGRAQLRKSKYGAWLAKILDWIDPKHCENAAKYGDRGKEVEW